MCVCFFLRKSKRTQRESYLKLSDERWTFLIFRTSFLTSLIQVIYNCIFARDVIKLLVLHSSFFQHIWMSSRKGNLVLNGNIFLNGNFLNVLKKFRMSGFFPVLWAIAIVNLSQRRLKIYGPPDQVWLDVRPGRGRCGSSVKKRKRFTKVDDLKPLSSTDHLRHADFPRLPLAAMPIILLYTPQLRYAKIPVGQLSKEWLCVRKKPFVNDVRYLRRRERVCLTNTFKGEWVMRGMKAHQVKVTSDANVIFNFGSLVGFELDRQLN